MRKNKKTIILAEIRRYIREICRRYNKIERLEYPKCYSEEQKEVEKSAIKIYNLFKR